MSLELKATWRNDSEMTSREWKNKRKRSVLSCPMCPAHGGENRTHRKRSPKKPRRRNQ